MGDTERDQYGELAGFTSMTSSGNKFSLSLTTEDDGEDFVAVLQYSGTRGRFIEEIGNWFKPGLEHIVEANDTAEIYADNYWGDLDQRNETVIKYETSGPCDMHPWETRADYIIRKGGNQLRDEVREILSQAAQGIQDANSLFAFGVKEEEDTYTDYYVGSSSLSVSSNSVLQYWFEDKATRSQRVTLAKSYFSTIKIANDLLSLV